MSSDIDKERNKMERPGFYWLSQAHYGKSLLVNSDEQDEIMIGDYPEEGGTKGEFAIRWYMLGELTPQLQAFNDSWKVLGECQSLLDELFALDGHHPNPEEIADLLLSLGFKDLTDRGKPDRICRHCGQKV